MKIAIIDDFLECRNEIQHCLSRFFTEHYAREPLCVTEFSSGEEFLSVFQKDMYDLIFIDQYMDGMTGIDTAKQIRHSDDLVTLVFITTSRDHAIDSYQVKAGGYLLKPFSYTDFEQTLRLLDLARLRNAMFIYVQNEKILLREILWCDVDGHYVQIHTYERGVLRYRISFGLVSDTLMEYPQFLLCYKGCIVNLEQVRYMGEMEFVLMTDEKILFAKRDRKKIENGYHAYLFQRAREEELL